MEYHFDWKYYLDNYSDLIEKGINNENDAYQHWINHGEKEGRVPFQIHFYKMDLIDKKDRVNSTYETGSRLGNMFIRNIISSKIALKNNLKFFYDRYNEFEKLGISDLFYKEGTNTYDEILLITDKIIDNVLFNDLFFEKYVKNKNILFRMTDYNPFDIWDFTYAQTRKISIYVKDQIFNNKNIIIEKNPYKERFNKNNDVFVHVRMGDLIHPPLFAKYEYYDKALSQISFEKGYISSDTIDHEICQKLIDKYNLQKYHSNEIETIHFASTCKNLVLSNGTFSWMIGIFGFFSNVYYPKTKIRWHGDIYVIPEWKEIDYVF